MTGRGAAVQGALAAVSLAATYFTWQREPDMAPGEVVVVDATKSTLENVRFEDESAVVDIFRPADDPEKGVWVRVKEKDKEPPKDKSKDGDKDKPVATPPAAPAAKAKPVRELRGGPDAERLLEKFAPLKSPRAFGTLDDKKVKELGLDAAKKRLSLTVRKDTRELVIGQPAQGSGESYVRDTRDGRTYLLPRALFSELQGAQHRLIERRLHAFKIADVNRILVNAGGKTRELVILGREDPHGYRLASAKASDKPDEMARNWHDKIWRLFPTELYGKGEMPEGGSPKVSLKVEYKDGGKQVGFIEIGTLEAGATPAASAQASTSPAPAQPKTELYGRTEFTPGWVRLTNDTTIIADAEKVAAGPP